MFDFKRQTKEADLLIRGRLDTIFLAKGYVHTRSKYKGNFWERKFDWCKKRCSLGIQAVGMTRKPEFIGGATIELPKFFSAIRREDWVAGEDGVGLGGPVHWIDKRLEDTLRFESFEEFAALLPKFERAFVECALPELERYADQETLLEALLQPDWLQSVKLSLNPDRRGALVTLMMAERDGKDKAIAWGLAEAERIKAEQPYVTTNKYYQEIERSINFLQGPRGQ